jgi:hypothetical protein
MGAEGREITTRSQPEGVVKTSPPALALSLPENRANVPRTVEEPLDLSVSPYHITLGGHRFLHHHRKEGGPAPLSRTVGRRPRPGWAMQAAKTKHKTNAGGLLSRRG